MKDKLLKSYEPDQSLLLPPNMNDWLPERHPASCIREVVRKLDLSAIHDAYSLVSTTVPAMHSWILIVTSTCILTRPA